MADRSALTVVLLAPGESLHTSRWAAALAGAGHRIIVASWRSCPGIAAVDLRIAPASGAPPACRMPLAIAWLRRLIGDVRPDLVHVHSVGVHGLLALALPDGPARVVTPWGSDLRAARRSAVRASVARLALNRADLVLPTSAEVAGEVNSRYRVSAERIKVLSWGVSEELIAALPEVCPGDVRSAFGIPSGATVVLSVRSTSATYRIQEVMSAFARAARDRPDLFLIVLGGYCPRPAAARRARDAYADRVRAAAGPVADRVLIVEHPLTPRQVFELMCAADLAVSIPPADQRSSSVLEAALAGCCLLLSDIAPYREMVSEGLAAQLLTEPIGDTLADALLHARADETTRRTNRDFVWAHERGRDKVAALEQTYGRLLRAR